MNGKTVFVVIIRMAPKKTKNIKGQGENKTTKKGESFDIWVVIDGRWIPASKIKKGGWTRL